jgi:hypothetical protein
MRCLGAQDIGGQLVDVLNLPGLRVGSVTGEVRSCEGRCAREARDLGFFGRQPIPTSAGGSASHSSFASTMILILFDYSLDWQL